MPNKRASKLTSKASAVLDAQVAFWVEQLHGPQFAVWIESEMDAVLADAKKLKLEDVVTEASVQAVALQYAANLEPSGAFPELVGEIARVIQSLPIQKSTQLKDLIPDRHFDEWLTKILELKSLRQLLIEQSLRNPVMHTVAGDLIYRGISGYLSQNTLAKGIPGAQSMLKLGKSMLSKASPSLDKAIEETLRKYIQQSLEATLRESETSLQNLLTDSVLRDAAIDIWAGLKGVTVNDARSTITHDDIEELFVIGYEHWRAVRKSNYYQEIISAGVSAFYKKYGKSTLSALLEDIGISREMILRDLLRFGPHALSALKRKKLLEPMARRLLEPFFHSEAAQSLFAE